MTPHLQIDSLVLDSENTRTYGREIFAGGKERARRQPWKGCRGRGTQPAARAAETAGREATSREKIRPDAASDHIREAENTSRYLRGRALDHAANEAKRR